MTNESEQTKNNTIGRAYKNKLSGFLPVVVRIALRNLFAHRSKTLIIGTLVTIGIVLLITGNSMLDTAEAGIRNTYIDNFTGNLILRSKSEATFSLLGADMNMMMGGGGLPQIPDYQKVFSTVSLMPEVQAATPQLSGQGMIVREEKFLQMLLLFGIDSKTYGETFTDNIEIVRGEFLKNGEDGILISETAAKKIEADNQYVPVTGDKMTIAGVSAAGFNLKEVTFRGVFKYKNSNELLDHVSLIDADTLRKILNMNNAGAKETAIGKDEAALLESSDEDNLFADTSIVKETATSGKDPLMLFDKKKDPVAAEEAAAWGADSGAWHFLVVRLRDGYSDETVAKKLAADFTHVAPGITIMNWQDSAGALGSLSYAVKIVFFVFILILAVVSVIIIMNTIVISITERIPEIGTMRAVGARKGFITRLILTEILFIVLVFGVIGIVLGTGLLAVLKITGIQAQNLYIEIIFGGKVLHPVLSPFAMLTALCGILAVGCIASFYPLSIALRIQPVRAIQSE
jgi:putative ABC transport system permease protein